MKSIEEHTKKQCKDKLHCSVIGIADCEISCYDAGFNDAIELITSHHPNIIKYT